MKKVLYISNIEVPYRTEFFNQLSKQVNLTVIYERKKSRNRNKRWVSSCKANFEIIYLKGINFRNEFTISLNILKYAFLKKYDEVIIGCYNSPSQILLIIVMSLMNRDYSINIDGDYDIGGESIKKRIKRLFIKKAKKIYVAGNQNSLIYIKYFDAVVIPYNFSSLTYNEIISNSKHINRNKNNRILVVGQYFDYKGLDVALNMAALDQENTYRFVGMGNRSFDFESLVKKMGLKNIEIIPFLDKEELFLEYRECLVLVLPSRKECWGLVVNEAASFGCPIISTFGCGAAKEFLNIKYECFLSKPNDAKGLLACLKLLKNSNIEDYKRYLIEMSNLYTIENMVKSYIGEMYNEKYNHT